MTKRTHEEIRATLASGLPGPIDAEIIEQLLGEVEAWRSSSAAWKTAWSFHPGITDRKFADEEEQMWKAAEAIEKQARALEKETA